MASGRVSKNWMRTGRLSEFSADQNILESLFVGLVILVKL
jgi:hypothetical protein